jgi:putrescine transport system substrate-binding protein
MTHLPAMLALALLAGCSSSEPPTAATDTGSTPAQAEEPVVNFANFVEEIAPDTLPAFTRETGLQVNFDTYETNLSLESRLMVGNTGFDVVVPGNNFLERQIEAGVYQPLDKSRLPNLRHVDPRILKQLEVNDPGNRHAVPYLWGTTSFGYDVRKVEAALGGPAPDSWALLFESKYAARLATCGISVVDSPWLMVGFALMYLGRDPNSESIQDLADAMRLLMAIRPYVRDITSMPATSPLVNGDVCFAVGPNAEFRAARALARDTGRDVEIRYVIPREGAMLWIDTLAIPKDAPHPGNAHRLIDYLMRPDVITGVTRAIYLPNANSAGNELLPPEIRNDPMIYPDAAAMERLHMNAALSDAYTRAQNREFTRFKAGR